MDMASPSPQEESFLLHRNVRVFPCARYVGAKELEPYTMNRVCELDDADAKNYPIAFNTLTMPAFLLHKVKILLRHSNTSTKEPHLQHEAVLHGYKNIQLIRKIKVLFYLEMWEEAKHIFSSPSYAH